jgi:hypothetical protein
MFVVCWHHCIVFVLWWQCIVFVLWQVTSVYCVCALLTSVHCVYAELTSVCCVCAVLTSACRYARELWSMLSLSLEWIFTQLTFPYTKTTFGNSFSCLDTYHTDGQSYVSLISDIALVILRTAELWTVRCTWGSKCHVVRLASDCGLVVAV